MEMKIAAAILFMALPVAAQPLILELGGQKREPPPPAPSPVPIAPPQAEPSASDAEHNGSANNNAPAGTAEPRAGSGAVPNADRR